MAPTNEHLHHLSWRADLLGYTPEEIRGKDFLDVCDPKSRALVAQRYERHLKGDPILTKYEITLQKKDGTLIEVELHGSVIIYQGKPAVQSSPSRGHKAPDWDSVSPMGLSNAMAERSR